MRHAVLVLAAIAVLATAVCAAPTVKIRNSADYPIQVQIVSGTQPKPAAWRDVARDATVQLPFKHGQTLLCRSRDGRISGHPHVIESAAGLRVVIMRIYGAPNEHHDNVLTVVTDDGSTNP